MAQNRKFAKVLAVLIVIVLSIIVLATTESRSSFWGSNLSTPTIVETQTMGTQCQLAWDCPGCPHG